ncbi:enolase C-terminal domain-like protein [Variovorax terrae]|uniref:Mandelate racemase/muconate lactonizing enzyme C-terminal domain-containing protein n=1 Tax=Variovorax terrae TaxID=2923278 RepID=A0A9X1VZG5_9BURK|nr:enolase C-terminal domain-like protein [Variovorax terrae]MCJ0766180.1 hypothetical protein [Variovorax terrae]
MERAELASALVAHGWRALKLRTSFPTIEEDIQVVSAVRKAVGPNVTILADGNKAGPYQAGLAGAAEPRYPWDLTRAKETAKAFADLGVGWLEEPLPRHDYAGMAQLRRTAALPIAGGENHSGIEEFRTLAESGSLDVLNPEVTLIGPSLFLQVGAIARFHGLRCVGHVGHGGLGSLCTWHLNAAWCDHNRIEVIHEPPIADYRHGMAIFRDPPTLQADGSIRLTDVPGLGVELDQGLLLAG